MSPFPIPFRISPWSATNAEFVRRMGGENGGAEDVMTEVGEPPAKHTRTWRPMILWTVVILLALGMIWLVVAGVLPVCKIRRIAEYEHYSEVPPSYYLGELGGPHKAAHSLALYLRLPDRWAPHKDVAIYLLDSCGTHGKPGVKALIGMIRREDPEIRWRAVNALGSIGPEASAAIPALLALLDDKAEAHCGSVPVQICPYAARALGRIGSDSAVAAPKIAAMLSSESPELRLAAAEALGDLGPVARDFAPLLKARLKDDDQYVRAHAAIALSRIGEVDTSSVPQLVEALEIEQFGLWWGEPRYWAAEALGNFGPAAKEAIPALEKALKRPLDPGSRQAAAEALKKIRGVPVKQPTNLGGQK